MILVYVLSWEREVIVCQTIHACQTNFKNHGKCFSFNEVTRDGPHADNMDSLDWLVESELLVRGKHEGKKVLYPTKQLIEDIEKHFKKQDERNKKDG